MRRLDHTMIFFLIAGTITPFAVLVMEPPLATALLIAVWGGALAGTIVELVWTDSPKWISASVYVAVGLIGAVGFPAIIAEAGLAAGILIAAGGALYVTGAVVYAVGRPDPSPDGLRLPRDLPRARHRGRGGALRGGGLFRSARCVTTRRAAALADPRPALLRRLR